MGSAIEKINKDGFRRNSSMLLNIKLSKLRDFHASFKSICQNFSIDLSQFQHIFGVGQSTFVVWDTDNNGLIDSLELFSGIAIFSQAKFEDKIRFLFDIFDFNEYDYLTCIDIEFMLCCSIGATYKIFSINNEIDTNQINQFLKGKFQHEGKIKVSDLIKFSKSSKEIGSFFQTLKQKQIMQIHNKNQ